MVIYGSKVFFFTAMGFRGKMMSGEQECFCARFGWTSTPHVSGGEIYPEVNFFSPGWDSGSFIQKKKSSSKTILVKHIFLLKKKNSHPCFRVFFTCSGNWRIEEVRVWINWMLCSFQETIAYLHFLWIRSFKGRLGEPCVCCNPCHMMRGQQE